MILSLTLRRAGVALAAVALSAGLLAATTTASHADDEGAITGKITVPAGSSEYYSLVVRQFSPTFNEWTHEGFDYDLSRSTGTYTFHVPDGLYRVGFNVSPSGASDYARELTGYWYGGTTSFDDAQTILVENGETISGIDATLDFTGGLVHGTVRDVAGDPLPYVEVYGYHDVDDPDGFSRVVETYTEEDGTYSLRTRGKPLYLRFTQDGGGYIGEFYNDALELDSPNLQAVTSTPGQDIALDDVVLAPAPIENEGAPHIRDAPVVGEKVRASEGSWPSNSLTYAYQWYRLVGGTEIKLSGATKSTYTPNIHDFNRRLKVVVTASQAGTSSVSVESPLSKVTKRGSTTSLSLTSPSKGKIKAVMKVRATGLSRASGKIKLACGLNVRFPFEVKSATLKSGKATITLKGAGTRTVSCQATYAATTYVAASTSPVKSVKPRRK